jgi:alkaline phosphatase
MILPLWLCFAFLPASKPPQPALKKPKNIILLIGDGMGISQITAAIYANGGKLNMERCPVTGLISTHSARDLVTDSAASATAFACGCKTKNGYLGMTIEQKPCKTIVEEAKSLGLATGLVATSSITHATPAAFVAHVPDRGSMEDIAVFFANAQVDLLIGGGSQYFQKRTKDTRNLCTEWATQQVQVYDYQNTTFKNLKPNPTHPLVWFSAEGEPESVDKGRTYLPDAAKLAPNFLKQRSDKGFFLMIEGSQIDWAGHASEAPRVIAETLDFDRAVGAALDFAEKDGETLVIVTADHETGGFAIVQGSTRDSLQIDFTTKSHTATMIPVFAYGPGSELFHGVYDNTDLYTKMRIALF